MLKTLLNKQIRKAMIVNRHQFYSRFNKAFQQVKGGQVEGFEAIFDEWESQKLEDHRWLAYILGTVWHETWFTMQPIEEKGRGKGRSYGQKLDYGNGAGHRVAYKTPDKLFYGRGLTQNTWRIIYQKLTQGAKTYAAAIYWVAMDPKNESRKESLLLKYHEIMGWDFLNEPELLLEMRPSVWATFYAMENGIYTGKRLANYFDKDSNDAYHARQVINGLDKAAQIAEYYRKFLTCL